MPASAATPSRACARSTIRTRSRSPLPLAEVELTSEPWRWGSRFTFDSSLLALTRTDGLDTRRVSATGGWELPWASQLGDQYRLALEPARRRLPHRRRSADLRQRAAAPTRPAACCPRMTADWSWPWIGDTFGLTPLVEPVASFTWTVDDPNDDDIPNEDSQDLEFDDSNLFSPSRFCRARPGRGRRPAQLRHALRRLRRVGRAGQRPVRPELPLQRRDDDFGPNSGIDDDFSDYVGRIELTPDPSFRVRYRFRLDQDDLTPTRNEVGALVGPRRLRFDVTYLSLEDDPALDRGAQARGDHRRGRRRPAAVAIACARRSGAICSRSATSGISSASSTATPASSSWRASSGATPSSADAEDATTFSVRVIFTNLGELGPTARRWGRSRTGDAEVDA